MNKIFDLKNKKAIVTGGYGYLGSEMCRALAQAGATVIVGGRNREKYHKVFTELERETIHFETLDIMDADSVKSFFNNICQNYGKVDVLVNNAFSLKSNKPEYVTRADLVQSFDGIIASVADCIYAAQPYFSDKAKVINISSMYGLVSPDFEIYKKYPQYFNSMQYGAAKAAIIQLTRYYANYFAEKGICVNCISPGPFPSLEVQKNIGFIDELIMRVPLKRIGNPKEITGALLLLSTAASDFITGQNIVIDGGWTIR